MRKMAYRTKENILLNNLFWWSMKEKLKFNKDMDEFLVLSDKY